MFELYWRDEFLQRLAEKMYVVPFKNLVEYTFETKSLREFDQPDENTERSAYNPDRVGIDALRLP